MLISGNNCPVCSSNEPKRVLYANGTLCALQCRQCGLIYSWPLPSSEEVDKLYPKEYYQSYIDEIIPRRIYTQIHFNKIQHWLNGKKGRLLDVGCGLGYFLDWAKRQGWEVTGLEPSAWAARYAEDHFKIEVFNCSLTEARFAEKSFDLITLWDVLGRLIDPIGYLMEIHRILKDDGLILLRVSIRDAFTFRFAQLMSKFTRNSYTLVHLPYQIYHFIPATLKRMLSQTGFQLVVAQFSRDYYAPPEKADITWRWCLRRLLILVGNRFRFKNTMLILGRKG